MQNTNSSAYLELKPLENTNFGSIIEEHNRYYRKYKEDKEARELARKNQEREFARKINNESFKTYEGLSPQDTEGFLNDQLISRFEKESPKIMQLSKEAASGDPSAVLKLDKVKREINAISKINELYTEQAQFLATTRAKDYNEFLDSNLESYQKALAEGKFTITDEFKINVYDPVNDKVITIEPSEFLNNSFLSQRYSGKVDFVKEGQELSKNLLDTIDGEKKIDKATAKRGVILANNKFASNPILGKSWYVNANRKGLVNIATPYEQMNEVERNALAKSFYENTILPNIQQTVNPKAQTKKDLDIANKSASLRNKYLEAQNKIATANKNKQSSEIEVLDDGEGGVYQAYTDDNTEKGSVFLTLPKSVEWGKKDDEGGTTTITGFVKKPNNEIVFLGNKVVVKGEDDDAVESTESVVIEDPVQVGAIIREIPTGENNTKFKNKTELIKFSNTKIKDFNKNNTPAESEEERLARIRKALKK